MDGRKYGDGFGNLCCSFCGKNQREVKKLIAGPTVYICDECIELCNDIIAEEGQKESPARSAVRTRLSALPDWSRPRPLFPQSPAQSGERTGRRCSH